MVTRSIRRIAGIRGANRLVIPKTLRKGTYRITIVAVDKARNGSRTVRLRLVIR